MAKMCPISIENAFGTQSGTLHNKKMSFGRTVAFSMEWTTGHTKLCQLRAILTWYGMACLLVILVTAMSFLVILWHTTEAVPPTVAYPRMVLFCMIRDGISHIFISEGGIPQSADGVENTLKSLKAAQMGSAVNRLWCHCLAFVVDDNTYNQNSDAVPERAW